MEIAQSKEDLLGHLKNQIVFLQSSTHSYDKGCDAEAIRMAIAIRVLVNDTPKYKSLLAQLNKKNILFYDTAPNYNPKNLMPHVGLASIELGGGGSARYLALLDDVPLDRLNKKVSFHDWWNKIVIVDKARAQFTRRSMILNVADKDGGAHIDPSLDQQYAALSRFNSLEWKVVVGGVESPFKNRPELACIRQITHEVLKSLKDEFGEYFNETLISNLLLTTGR